MVLKMSFLKALLMLVFSHNVSLGYFLLSFFTQVYSLLQSTAHFLTAFFFSQEKSVVMVILDKLLMKGWKLSCYLLSF